MGLKSIKTSPGLDSSIATAGSIDDGELSLYEDLMAFTVLSPEEQEANAKQYESKAAVTPQQPTGELSSGCIEIGQGYLAADESAAPQVPEPLRNTFPSSGITRAATITVYKSQPRPAGDEDSNQNFVVLDAEELLSETAEDQTSEEHDNEPMSDIGPLDVQFSHSGGEARIMAVCRSCGYQSDGEDMLCLGCGALLEEQSE
ncbi:MAG TPA: hypothetical protein VNO14_09015 [Blastocatellia bacterium]|nr:hypothetical protein [Blastocatellia bacterium]